MSDNRNIGQRQDREQKNPGRQQEPGQSNPKDREQNDQEKKGTTKKQSFKDNIGEGYK